ncbi:MAG: DUF1838 family protein, partial [Gammaproteobacteria bacterium]|nr:DUF1838 family protein [Gammaproteobacteria bacterium]
MNKKIDRRSVLLGAGVATVATAATVMSPRPYQAAEKPRQPINFADDMDNVRAYAKLAGTLADDTVHYWYRGTIFGATPDDTKAMLGFTGLLKMSWKNLGNGSFHYRNFDLGYFTEPDSDVRIEEFTNPFTGITNRPIDIKGGPFDVVITPRQYEWTRSGDDIWFSEAKHFKFANKLSPEEWPTASTGDTLNMLYLDGFNGKVSDLENPELDSAPSILGIHHVNPWYPFFLMGQQPGVNYWHGKGKKIADESDV